ncbi:hypothetical protein [Rhizobium sp. NLR22b]|uniref:hypothetical protein n=1 Tax=Rhizobium sp. NLR22b TaxID=2731115 RepID=UPI001C83969D|nr:hypothetical protein [Rhizobium sp. NLR22b]MBX5239513.1 hypothetical protein [Rhizobium sp. NLR22b]
MLVFLSGFLVWLLAVGALLAVGYDHHKRGRNVVAFLCASIAWALFSLPYTWATIDGGAPLALGLLVNIPLAASVVLLARSLFRR